MILGQINLDMKEALFGNIQLPVQFIRDAPCLRVSINAILPRQYAVELGGR
jgi:hypothetical protein